MPATLSTAISILFVLLVLLVLAARVTPAPETTPPGVPPWLRGRWAVIRRSRWTGPVVVGAMLLGFLLLGSIPPPRLDGSPELARRLVSARQPRLAERVLRPVAESNLDDVEIQHEYISAYFAARRSRRSAGSIRAFYETMHGASTGHRRDVAAYALGFYWLSFRDPEKAVAWFERVADPRLPHLHDSWGEALLSLGEPESAEHHFWQEIENGHAVGAATANLAAAALGREDWAGLERLATDSRTRAHLPRHAFRALLLHLGEWGSYLLALLRSLGASFDALALLVVLLGAVPWVLIVRAWDVFEEEPLALALLTVAGGALTTLPLLALHDFMALSGVTGPREYSLGDWIVRVGLVEEAVKLLPLVPIVLFTRQINEPSDWVVYGGLSAMGFALAENYNYAQQWGIGLGFARTFVTVPLHVTFTGLVVLSIPQAGLRGWSAVKTFVLAWLVVGTVHGLYNYLLDGGAEFLAMLLALGWAAAFTVWHEQVAMLSPFRAATAGPVDQDWGWQLFLYAYGMGVLVFLIHSIQFHPWFAMRLLAWHLYTLVGGAFLMVFFSSFSVPAGTVESLRRRLRQRQARDAGASAHPS